jgi:MoaA/NifB/PqqE/SkfB family radical SAM enzyme
VKQEETSLCHFPFDSMMANTSGIITTCCWGEPIINEETGMPYTRHSHTLNQVFYSKEMQKLRSDLLSGIKNNNCKKCWRAESEGRSSMRLQEIRTEGEFDQTKIPQIENIFLSLGNQCNLKCRTCGIDNSSTWVKEHYDTNNFLHENTFSEYQKSVIFLEEDSSMFVDSILKENIHNANELIITGGEPLMMKNVWKLLDNAVAQGYSKNMALSFHTNCTFWNEKAEQIISKFNEVEISLSIDGVDNRFEYMRHPAKWEQVLPNIDKIIGMQSTHSSLSVSITFAVSSYNVWYLPEVFDFADSKGIVVNAHLLHTPDFMSIRHIPKSIAEEISHRLLSQNSHRDESKKVIDYMNVPASDSYNQWNKFLQEIDLRDRYRGESFADTFPEYYSRIVSHG